jgi:hypothetical protein
MIKHFAADGTVKREWPEGLHASARFERNGKQFVEVAKSNAIETVEVVDGEQVGEALHAADVLPMAADVHPIEAALTAETAAHALSDAAEVLKQEEARAEHSTEAAQIPTSEASNG